MAWSGVPANKSPNFNEIQAAITEGVFQLKPGGSVPSSTNNPSYNKSTILNWVNCTISAGVANNQLPRRDQITPVSLMYTSAKVTLNLHWPYQLDYGYLAITNTWMENLSKDPPPPDPEDPAPPDGVYIWNAAYSPVFVDPEGDGQQRINTYSPLDPLNELNDNYELVIRFYNVFPSAPTITTYVKVLLNGVLKTSTTVAPIAGGGAYVLHIPIGALPSSGSSQLDVQIFADYVAPSNWTIIFVNESSNRTCDQFHGTGFTDTINVSPGNTLIRTYPMSNDLSGAGMFTSGSGNNYFQIYYNNVFKGNSSSWNGGSFHFPLIVDDNSLPDPSGPAEIKYILKNV